jgi:hypothetical protein
MHSKLTLNESRSCNYGKNIKMGKYIVRYDDWRTVFPRDDRGLSDQRGAFVAQFYADFYNGER